MIIIAPSPTNMWHVVQFSTPSKNKILYESLNIEYYVHAQSMHVWARYMHVLAKGDEFLDKLEKS